MKYDRYHIQDVKTSGAQRQQARRQREAKTDDSGAQRQQARRQREAKTDDSGAQRQQARRQREAKTVGRNVNKRDDNVKRSQTTVGRNVNKRDDSWAQRWCDVSTSPTTATGDTANRNDSDVTTYNRQTTTDDTAIYGISDAHVNEVHSQSAIDIGAYMGVYRTYNNRVVPKSDGISQRMIRNECKYLFEALTTGLSALRPAISSLLTRPPLIYPFGTLAVFRQVKRCDLWSSCISPFSLAIFPSFKPLRNMPNRLSHYDLKGC